MGVCHELPVPGERLERLLLELGVVALYVVEDLRFEDEEGAVYPALRCLGLLGELGHHLALYLEVPEPRRRPYGSEGGYPAVRGVEGKEPVEVYIRHAVPPGEHEGPVAGPGLQALYAPAPHCVLPGGYEVDRPVRHVAVLQDDLSGAGLHRHVAVEGAVVLHPPLDVLALVAEGYREVCEAVDSVIHHDVPEDGVVSHLHHRLWLQLGLLGEPGAPASPQYPHFHSQAPLTDFLAPSLGT